ncbi:GNAT family N-acetyltransferase [Streptomyces roseifaciens]
MRRATKADVLPMADLIRSRATWMIRHGLDGGDDWEQPERARSIAERAADGHTPVWAMIDEDDRSLAGFTTLRPETPPWGWTDAERAAPALVLMNTFTDPDQRSERTGALMAWWALGHAARTDKEWVRRACTSETLVRYYRDVQGFEVVRSVRREGVLTYLLAREAEVIPGLPVLTSADAIPDRLRYSWPLNPAVPITYRTA